MPLCNKVMSVSRAAAITAAFVKDGVRKTSARKLAKSSRDRDLFRWVKLPWEPYEVNIPLIKRRSADKEVVDEKVGILLPTDLLGHMYATDAFGLCIFGDSGKPSLLSYWQSEDQDWLNRTGISSADLQHCIPLFFHEDSVPSFKEESYTFWSWASLSSRGAWMSRNCIVGLPSSRVLPQTRSAVVSVLNWNLDALARGTHPEVNHLGKPWPPGTRAAKIAGTPIAGPYFGRFSCWQGDMEARVLAHCLDARHYRH